MLTKHSGQFPFSLQTKPQPNRKATTEGCSRREPLIGLGLCAKRSRELAAGLACPQQRAREHDFRVRVLGPQPLAEGAGLLAALRSQRAQLVRLSGGGFGMTDEVEAHGAGE